MMRRRNKLRRFINHILFSVTESNDVEFSTESETILRLGVDQAEKFGKMILELVRQIRENPAERKDDVSTL
jgi:hypothetical protein